MAVSVSGGMFRLTSIWCPQHDGGKLIFLFVPEVYVCDCCGCEYGTKEVILAIYDEVLGDVKAVKVEEVTLLSQLLERALTISEVIDAFGS